MPQITTRTTPNNQILFVSICDYCGKEFAYPYKAQTENNILSHMKYCKYKTRDAPTPTITQEPQKPQQTTPQKPEPDYKAFYEKYHQIIEEFQNNGLLP